LYQKEIHSIRVSLGYLHINKCIAFVVERLLRQSFHELSKKCCFVVCSDCNNASRADLNFSETVATPDVMHKPRPIKLAPSEFAAEPPGPSVPRPLPQSTEESRSVAAFRPQGAVFKPQQMTLPSPMSASSVAAPVDMLLQFKNTTAVAPQSTPAAGILPGSLTSLAGLWSGGGLVTTASGSNIKPTPMLLAAANAISATTHDGKLSAATAPSSLASSNMATAASPYVAAAGNVLIRSGPVSSFQLLVSPGAPLISSSSRPFPAPQLQYVVAFSDSSGAATSSKLVPVVPGVTTALPSAISGAHQMAAMAAGFQLAIPGAVQPLVMLGVAQSPQGQQFSGHPQHPSILPVPLVVAPSNTQAQLLK
jgi:hypothetical protein